MKNQIRRNNVVIEYSQCGEGNTTLLFMHGWSINKEYWEAQIKELQSLQCGSG